MGMLERSTSTSSRGKSSGTNPKPSSSSSGAQTVTEARLSLQGTENTQRRGLDFHTAYSKWLIRFAVSDQTPAELQERQIALTRDWLALKRSVEDPPEEWTGEEWLRLYRRLQGWEGQLRALEDVVRKKAAPAATRQKPETARKLRFCPSGSTLVVPNDPFADPSPPGACTAATQPTLF